MCWLKISKNIGRNVSGVYLIQCKVNGKCYIGSSEDISRRLSTHYRELENNQHSGGVFQKDWIEYGAKNFTYSVLAEMPIAEARKVEIEYIQKFNSEKFGYNTSSYINSVKIKESIICENILKYIEDTFKNDGNVYCYDFFKMAKAINLTPVNFFKFLGLNCATNFNNYVRLNDNLVIGIAWTKLNIFIQVAPIKLTSSDFIEVDIEVF